LVSQDRVEKAAQDYLRALISNNPATVLVKLILLGDSGGFSSEELATISRGGSTKINSSSGNSSRRSTRMDNIPIPSRKTKQKRKVSRYQRVFGKNLKALKRKHPRTDISVLMKKAHRMTRREMK
jgi:hypothetical protein